jgi:hypothetical protein
VKRGETRGWGQGYRATLVLCVCIIGCLPSERINAACRWSTEAVVPPAGDHALRAHLIEDVRIARDLGIRYADASAGRMNTPAWRGAKTWCTERSLAEIEGVHHVSGAELAIVAGTRELWIDMLAVMLPMAVLFAVASRVIVARTLRGYDQNDRGVATVMLVALAPIVAGLAVAVAQIWGVMVEQLRVRNSHISDRAFDLPANRHGWLLWAVAMALFAGTGGWKLLGSGALTPRRRTTG